MTQYLAMATNNFMGYGPGELCPTRFEGATALGPPIKISPRQELLTVD